MRSADILRRKLAAIFSVHISVSALLIHVGTVTFSTPACSCAPTVRLRRADRTTSTAKVVLLRPVPSRGSGSGSGPRPGRCKASVTVRYRVSPKA